MSILEKIYLKNSKPCDECLKKKRDLIRILLIARYKDENSFFSVDNMPLDIFKILVFNASEIQHKIPINFVMQVSQKHYPLQVPCSFNTKYLKYIISVKMSLPLSALSVFITDYDNELPLPNEKRLIEHTEHIESFYVVYKERIYP